MAKKKAVFIPKIATKKEATVEDLVNEAQKSVEEIFHPLGNEDYLEAMNQLGDFCSSCVLAKEEEMIADEEEDAALEDEEENED